MEKYLQYTSEDFALEESFINWVKNPEQKNTFWEEWVKNNPNKSADISKAKSIVENLRFKSEDIPSGSQKKIWAEIDQQLNTDTKVVNKPSGFRRSFLIGLAASFFGALLYFGFLRNDFVQVTTSFAEMNQVALPDKSFVKVNADSKVKYDKKSWKEKREVFLEGEAFFEVEKGSSFVVNTDLGTVEVLGTSFNVYARNNHLSVHCETGRVSVKYKGQETILKPTEKIEVKDGVAYSENKSEKFVDRGSWRNGVYKYSDKNLEEIIKDVQRNWNVKVDLPADLSQIKFTGSYKSDDMEKALSEVCWPLNLKYSIDGSNISITR